MLASGLAFGGDNSGASNGAPGTALDWDLFNTFGGGNDFGAMARWADWQPFAARFDKQVPLTRSFILGEVAGILFALARQRRLQRG